MTADPPAPATNGFRAAPAARPGRWPRSAGTKRAVLDAAAVLFAERGYDGTSIDDIVKRSGVSVGSIYHQFSGKSDVFLAVAAEDFERHTEASVKEMRTARAAGAGPTEIYLAGASAFLMSTWRNREVARVMLGTAGPPNYDGIRNDVLVRLQLGASTLRLVGTPPNDRSAAHAVVALMRAASTEVVEAGTAAQARAVVDYFTGLIARLVVDEGVDHGAGDQAV